ncbi:anti-sigma-I factor RsgI [Bacillus cereus group sp. Bc222]|uniref:anti-sigma-I factor RsgI n=1 Tax=Bacillus cereus group TaxID=86661 RepID=UPI0009447E0C|nr:MULTISPECIES: anti-sigma-I factor RsgI [Bacillus cereus group]MCU5175834.1 anti-sigma-I factor RsgI [Bacillus paranthracis]MDA2154753.1 anti-sigma-I factor RsgI [Bacillus cereus group sp. Bc253]MDA2238750.1 anti-sigma-I factor RsgI [Bacillus cereus group sp. Bc222]MDA2587364.1 anti-sigma-I factor RsgI [Bacillus cereus group sp. Bc062]
MMNKGIVMDIKKHSVVVLTPNGEFITCKRKGDSCMIGEEISFDEQEQKASRFSIPYFLKPASLLVACFLCALLFFYNQPEEKVFAYVSVDINPSLEVSVTKDLRVIDLQACNDDGRRILKELKQWENKQLQEVIRTIIKQSQEDKYLTNDKQVMLTAIAKDKLLEPKLEKVMKELKKEYELKHITVEYQSSTMQVRENARKAGIGTGVYIMQENEKNKSVTPPATPSNPVENEEEVQSQPESSPDPDVSPDLSSVKDKKYEKPEHKEQKKIEEQPTKQIKENNGRGSQQENRGNKQENNGRESQQGNNGNQQGNNGRESQQGNNGNQQGNNGRGSQGNNGNQQGNNGRGSQGNNGHQQENNGRGSQGNNGNQQGNNGRGSQGNTGHQQENNGRGSQGNNGHQQENNGRGSQKESVGNEQGNNGRGSQQENRGHQQGNEKKNQ